MNGKQKLNKIALCANGEGNFILTIYIHSYTFIIGLNGVVCTAISTILSAVMASKLIIEEYAPKKAILLFSYLQPNARVSRPDLCMLASKNKAACENLYRAFENYCMGIPINFSYPRRF